MNLTLADFDYTLPPELIAKRPITPRDHARVLVTRPDALDDRHIYDLPQLLRAGDLLVFNDTKVIPARLIGTVGTARVEILLHRALATAKHDAGIPINNSPLVKNLLPPCGGGWVGGSIGTSNIAGKTPSLTLPTRGREKWKKNNCNHNTWEVMARPGKKLKLGVKIIFADENPNVIPGLTRDPGLDSGLRRNDKIILSATVTGKDEIHGTYFLRFDQNAQEFWDGLQKIGSMPIPPYFERDGDAQDITDYQSQFAQHAGAVAAPTASLHFTPELLARLATAGINTATITLHVGAGTFMPVRVDNIADHVMHQEWCQISQIAADTINQTRQRGGRLIAVGTTVARTLETAAGDDGTIRPIAQDTQIFITPGYQFRAIDGMVTNFHLPQSTLLMMVSALMGMERIKTAYAHAIAARYRFYSYGDAMLLWPRN